MTWNTQSQLCLIALALLVAGAVLAAPALALRVEGARIALDVEPGMTYTSRIGISIEPEESEGTFAIDVMGFGQSTADGSYTALEAAEDTSPYSARPFITIDSPTVHLKPGEQADVTATITVPAGISDGGRYAIILVHPAPSGPGAPAAFATAVAIPVFLTVKGGTVTETGEILSLTPAAVEPAKPFEVVVTCQNSGNHHYYGVVSSVRITDASGKEVASATTEPFVRAIVPGEAVDFTMPVKTGLAQGTYQMTASMKTRDGKVLAEKTIPLAVGNPRAARETPGFGVLVAVSGMMLACSGILWCRRSRRSKR
jgi:hypothetical protein